MAGRREDTGPADQRKWFLRNDDLGVATGFLLIVVAHARLGNGNDLVIIVVIIVVIIGRRERGIIIVVIVFDLDVADQGLDLIFGGGRRLGGIIVRRCRRIRLGGAIAPRAEDGFGVEDRLAARAYDRRLLHVIKARAS